VFPWGHFLIAFLPVVTYVVVRDRRLPTLRFVGSFLSAANFQTWSISRWLISSVSFPRDECSCTLCRSRSRSSSSSDCTAGRRIEPERVRRSYSRIFRTYSPIITTRFSDRILRFLPDLLWPFAPPIARPIVPEWAGPGRINVELWTLFSIAVLSIVTYSLTVDVREQLRIEREPDS